MDEMIGYIFSNLRSSENAVKSIRKTLNNQVRFNRAVTTFAWMVAVYVIWINEKNIQKLNKEINELKRMKGV